MRLFDAIDTPKQLYLICENIEGKMLHNILRAMPGRRLHAKICARIFKQIVFGMATFHEQWICHRDLKPENILVNMDCPNYTTKIIDFGFATRSKDKLQIFCGTPAFMSPEICQKSMYNGQATDVWASGVILFTMLFGHQPFQASTEQELYRRIQKGQYKLPAIKPETNTFENYSDIEDASTIKALVEDILNLDEADRITAAQILDKYEAWLG